MWNWSASGLRTRSFAFLLYMNEIYKVSKEFKMTLFADDTNLLHIKLWAIVVSGSAKTKNRILPFV